jgi:hypothetical protein
MGKWRDAFLKSLDPKFQNPKAFEFGSPATDKELAALFSAFGAPVPDDLADLLREFNGIKQPGIGFDMADPGEEDDPELQAEKEPYYFSTAEMPSAGEYYREWDCDTTLAMEWFKNVMFVCQENGFASMWAVVAKPFETFKPGDVVSFDHDRLMFAETASDLFVVNYPTLLQLVEARFKDE